MSGIRRRKTAQRTRARNPGHHREKIRAIKIQPSQALGSLSRTHSRASSQKTRPPAQAARYVLSADPRKVASQNKRRERDPGQPAPLDRRKRGPEQKTGGHSRDHAMARHPVVSAWPSAIECVSCSGAASEVMSDTSIKGEEVDNFTGRVIAIAGGEDGETVGFGCRPQIGRSLPGERFDRWQAGDRHSGSIILDGKKVVRSPRWQIRWQAARETLPADGSACRRAPPMPRLTKSRNPTSPLTGFPGNPKTRAGGRSPRGGPTPNQSGLPGLRRDLVKDTIAHPEHPGPPEPDRAAPAETPPVMTRISASSPRPGSRPADPEGRARSAVPARGRPPRSPGPGAAAAFELRIWPGPGTWPGSTSSSPVGTIATCGRGTTWTSVRPTDARTPAAPAAGSTRAPQRPRRPASRGREPASFGRP